MPEGLFTLLLFSVVMAITSFGAGMLPLAVSLSPSQLRLISTVGMGVLVGTSLIVIIPEGIDTIYSAKLAPPSAMSPTSGPMLRGRAAAPAAPWSEHAANLPHHHSRDAEAIEAPDTRTHTVTTPPHGHDHSRDHDSERNAESSDPEHERGHEHSTTTTETAHKWVGLSLISGFILMYLIDVLPHQAHKHNPQPYHIEIDNLRSLSASSPPLDSPSPSHPYSKTSSTTLGLVIHAAADGIALGASSTSSNTALEAIVFLAIMLHKAPAAFGLSAVLLRAGLGKRQARAHLIVFSMAAPVGAVWWTGVLLLFSGGTFLYVAMHTMQGQSELESGNGGQKSTMKDTLAAVVDWTSPSLDALSICPGYIYYKGGGGGLGIV
ncbi:unnamed protein product [Tuber aestivum]|uniref:Zinc/iron permease n=1 Tax=Tuber aestivum TaxID=59557 RepID=A0A292PTR6_9PEZI|nr:unnamed protein product [Tuber aestivum]